MKFKDITVCSKNKEIKLKKRRQQRHRGQRCCIPGCGKSSNNEKVFTIPNGKKKRRGVDTKQWSEKFFKILFEIRDPDNNNFKKQLERGTGFICVDHFKPEDICYNLHTTTIKHGRLPSIFDKSKASKNGILVFKEPTQTTDKNEETQELPLFEHEDVQWDEYLHPTFGKQSYGSTSSFKLRQTNEDFEGKIIEHANRTIYFQNGRGVTNPHTSSMDLLAGNQRSDEVIVLPFTDPPILPGNIDLEENKDILKIDLIDLIFKFDECCEKMSDVIKAHPNMDNSELMCFYKLLALEVKCLQDKLNKRNCKSSISVPTKKKQKQYDQNYEHTCELLRKGPKIRQLPVLMVAEGLGPKFCRNKQDLDYTSLIFEKYGWNRSYISSSVACTKKQRNLRKRAEPVFVKTVTVGVPALRGCEIAEKKTISTENSSLNETDDRGTNVACADNNSTSCLHEEDEASQHLLKKSKPRLLLEEKYFKEQLLEKRKHGSKATFVKCDICKRKYYSSDYLIQHECVPKETTQCQLCNKVYQSRNMEQHMTWHDKMHGVTVPTCPCGMKFKNKQQLNIHSTFPPTCILPNFACTVCHEAFFTVDDMKEHLLQKPCCCILFNWPQT